MQEKIGFSFILTNYNTERYIGEAIRSVFNQVYDGPMELIVVDDCSTDNSWNVIQETIKQFAGDFDVKCVKTPQNGGTANSVDTGMALAKYDWLVMIDGDDVQLPHRTSYTVELIKKYPDVQGIVMGAKAIGKNGEDWNYNEVPMMGVDEEYDGFTSPKLIYREAAEERLQDFLIEESGVKVKFFQGVIRKKLYELWGALSVGEMKHVRFYQDLSWGARAALTGPILASSQPVMLYRYHGNNQYALTCPQTLSAVEAICEEEYLRDKRWPGVNRTNASVMQSFRRAIDNSSLTDWSVDQIKLAMQQRKLEVNAYSMMEMWWLQNWFVRVFRVLRYGWRVRPVHLRMVLWRLLPLKLFCYMKSKKNG